METYKQHVCSLLELHLGLSAFSPAEPFLPSLLLCLDGEESRALAGLSDSLSLLLHCTNREGGLRRKQRRGMRARVDGGLLEVREDHPFLAAGDLPFLIISLCRN